MISDCTESTWLRPSWTELAKEPSLKLSELRAVLEGDSDLLGDLRELQELDPSRPYGRRVLVMGTNLEVMLASWTRGIECAPHDHGGSQGVVRVLQGRARHRIYTAGSNGLECVRDETAEAGEMLICGRHLVHSMADDGADAPLVTLHMYTGSIQQMVVYDTAANRTLVVDGGCGAWVPDESSGLILGSYSGIVPTHELL